MTRRMILIVGLVGALLLAACGGDTAGEPDGVASLDETTTTGPESNDAEADEDSPETVEEAYMAFTECMREEGVDMPDPEVDADGNIAGIRMGDPDNPTMDVETMRAASEVCQPLLEGFTIGAGDVDQSAAQDSILEFAACMRNHGIDFPDPDFTGGGVTFGGQSGGGAVTAGGGPGNFDPDDPAVQEAMDVCNEILDEAGVVRNTRPGN